MLEMLNQVKNSLSKKLVQSDFTVFWYLKGRALIMKIDDFIKKRQRKKPILHLLEYHVTGHCNMNFKSCFHFSNLVKKAEFGDLAQYIRDLRRLSELFSNIKHIHLMGGEPLLNSELPIFITKTKRIFPNTRVHILTNGMLIPKMTQDLIDTILINDVFIRVSIYKPMINIIADVSNFLMHHNIKHWISSPYLHFAKYININGNSNPKKVVTYCPASRCTFLSNGKITRCALPFNIYYFNKHFNQNIDMNKDQIDIYDETIDGFKIKKRLLQPMHACRYCKKVEWIPWAQEALVDRSDTTLAVFNQTT